MGFFVLALLSSVLASLLGVGGGFILLPALLYIASINYIDAVFISLCSILFLSILQLMGHRDFIRSEMKTLWPLAVFSGLGSFISTYFVLQIQSQYMEYAFSILLCLVAIKLLLDKKDEFSRDKVRFGFLAHPLFFFSGSLSGLFGIGGGILNVPILNQILRYPMKDSTTLSFFFVFLTSSVALVFQFQARGDEIRQLPPAMIFFLLAGVFVGHRIARRIKISNKQIRLLFGLLLLIVGLSSFISR